MTKFDFGKIDKKQKAANGYFNEKWKSGNHFDRKTKLLAELANKYPNYTDEELENAYQRIMAQQRGKSGDQRHVLPKDILDARREHSLRPKRNGKKPTAKRSRNPPVHN